MFEKILVPLDGSELAERAIEPALSIACKQQGEVMLLTVPVQQHIILPSTAGYGMPLSTQAIDQTVEHAEQYLEKLCTSRDTDGAKVTGRVIDGDVASVIVDTAAKEESGLILMTTHGYSGFTRWMLGSVTERVLRGAPCPVLVIRDAAPVRKILITLDGSRLAEEALLPGLEIARLFECTTVLLRVDQEEKLSSVELGILEVTSSELCQEVGQAGDRVAYYLECVAEKFRLPKQELQTAVVKGKPADCILEYIDGQHIDLVCMATHGYSGLRRWVYGSVTEKVLRKANCAKLVVRPPAQSLN